MTATDELLRNAEAFARTFEDKHLGAPPAKRVAVVACMDARVDLFAIFGLTEGDAHVLRNAGGLVTDDVLRSLVISQHLLGTEEILVVHHTDCGMMSFRDDEVQERVAAATGVRPPFALGAFDDLEVDVRRSTARLRDCPFLVHRDRVRGFVYEVESGRVRPVT